MKKMSFDAMENVQGGSAYACGAMVLWGITGVILAAGSVTIIGMAGALAAGAAMLDSANNCVS